MRNLLQLAFFVTPIFWDYRAVPKDRAFIIDYNVEQNTLPAAVLTRIGFRATSLAARVRLGLTQVMPRTHMLLRVSLPEGIYLADVGFGGLTLTTPFPAVSVAPTDRRDAALADLEGMVSALAAEKAGLATLSNEQIESMEIALKSSVSKVGRKGLCHLMATL